MYLLPSYTVLLPRRIHFDRGRNFKSLSFVVGGSVFYEAGTDCVTNYKNCTSRSSVAGMYPDKHQGHGLRKSAKYVCTESLSYLCRLCKELQPSLRYGTAVTLTL
jgi:hypothetical protein